MRLLLDTHVALWAIADSPRLPAEARRLIADPANEIYASVATVWEIAIKHGLRRADMPISGGEAFDWFRQAGYRLLSILPEHAAAVDGLPALHADPFDRILVAQARTEPMRLVTHDAALGAYGEAVLVV